MFNATAVSCNDNKLKHILLNQDMIFDKLVESAAIIALHNFEFRNLILLFVHENMGYNLSHFKSYLMPVVIQDNLYLPNIPNTIRQFILFTTNIEDLYKKLFWLNKYQFDNTGKYIIICREDNSHDCDESKALKISWNYKIVNVIYLKINSDIKEVDYFTFFPYIDGKCENSDTVKVEVSKDVNKIFESNFFPRKCYNMGSCIISVSTFDQIPFMKFTDSGKPFGVDGDLLVLIADSLNSTLKIVKPMYRTGWGILEANGNWSGSLGDIYNGLANFSIISGVLSLVRYEHFQISSRYNTIDMAWVTSSAKLKPAWLKLIRPFRKRLIITLTVTFIVVILLSFFFKSKYWDEIRNYLNIGTTESTLMYYTWMSLLGLPIATLPKHPCFLTVTMIWIWLAFLLRATYQSALIGSLNEQVYYSEFKSLHEAMDAKYRFGGVISLREYYLEDRKVFNEWTELDAKDIEPSMMKISEGWNFVLAMSKETTKSFLRTHKERQIHIIPQKIIKTPIVIFFKKYSPFAEPINKILINLVEAGFVDKSYKDYANINVMRSDQNKYKPLNLDNLNGCYIIIITGFAISTIVFILELYFSYIKKINVK